MQFPLATHSIFAKGQNFFLKVYKMLAFSQQSSINLPYMAYRITFLEGRLIFQINLFCNYSSRDDKIRIISLSLSLSLSLSRNMAFKALKFFNRIYTFFNRFVHCLGIY